MEYIFLFFHFQPMCILRFKLSLLSFKLVLGKLLIVGPCFYNHSANLCPLMGEFRPLKLIKIITDRKELTIAILLLVNLYVLHLFVLYFLSYYLPLCLVGNNIFCFLSHFLCVHSIPIFFVALMGIT